MIVRNPKEFVLTGTLKNILFPVLWLLSLIYGSVLWLRNKFFDIGWLTEKKYALPVISIGNITVGGTGKTPMTEYVINLLKGRFSVAVLSRGYKRKTKGFILAESKSTVVDIGDEPLQILSKFPGVTVAVAEKRTEGIEQLLKIKSPDVIVLDDAFQHRYVKPGLSVLLIDYNRPLWEDYPFPAGRLREPASGKKRADIIVVSKCPTPMTAEDRERMIKKLEPCNGQQVFFTSVSYSSPVNYAGREDEFDKNIRVLALAGIARPEMFFDHISEKYRMDGKLIFPDHHSFSTSDCRDIERAFNALGKGEKAVVCTEKDFMRLKNSECLSAEIKSHIWYIPIKVTFIFDEEKKFNQLIYSYVEKDKKDR